MVDATFKLKVAPLPSLNRADEVARELGSQIRSGMLPPDTRLPSEQTMAALFGVSRTVVREAIARLKNEGLVKTRQGSGAFVRDWMSATLHLDPQIGENLESVVQIVELRKGLEAEAAALAATRRTRKELTQIEKALLRVEELTAARGDSAKADMAFHRAIAEASHNPYFIAVLDYLSQFLVTAVRVSRGNEALREDFARQVHVEHLNILDAIRRKDNSAARLAAQIHLDQARLRIQQAARDFAARGLSFRELSVPLPPVPSKAQPRKKATSIDSRAPRGGKRS